MGQNRIKMFFLHTLIFLSAFLLFQIELIIAKIFLPKFGGSYLVWGAAVVFFQITLLLGYLYSHLVVQKLGIYRYRYFHLALLFLPLVFFPGRPLPLIQPQFQLPLVLNVFWQLLFSIGVVFFVLSTVSIIFQSWLATSSLPQALNPYALYATSNLGSFAALLSYPLFFEAFFDLSTQLNIWRVGYLFLLILNLAVFKLVKVTSQKQSLEQVLSYSGGVSSKEKWRWFLWGMAGAVMFLSVTNIITYEVAPIPLLWIFPLSIYLLSFVLNFKKNPLCPSWIRDRFHLTAGFSILLFFLTEQRTFPFIFLLIAYLIALFIICMFCQNELTRHKPADNRNLTLFYLLISGGSAAGGILVSWIIPLASVLMIEFLFGLLVISFVLMIDEPRKGIGFYNLRLIVYALCLIILWPMVFQRYNIFGLLLIAIMVKLIFAEFKNRPRAFYLSLLAILCISPFIDYLWTQRIYTYRSRNYYGIYKIYDKKGVRYFLHGTTLHGAQYLEEEKQAKPLTYFHPLTPIGELMTSGLFSFRRIGVMGLGTGTLSAYTDASQEIDFFELDPSMYYIASNYFTYLKKSPGKINFIFGDARLSLDKNKNKRYELLVMDAFSGDSIPIHLLTTEAILKYKTHITEDGLLLFHISNRYVDLMPVLFSNARMANVYICSKFNESDLEKGAFASEWVALSWDSQVLEKLVSQLKWKRLDYKAGKEKLRPWTDQYYNILQVIKLKGLSSQIKEFQPFYW